MDFMTEHKPHLISFERARKAEEMRMMLDQTWLRSAFAVLVGTLALFALACDSKALRYLAAGVGTALPALHLVSLLAIRWFIKRTSAQWPDRRAARGE